jgi:hypothetical protein
MLMPAAVSQRDKIWDEVEKIEAALSPDVVHIRFNIGEDWKDDWSIFFRIVLSDDAAKNRLSQVADNVELHLAEHLDFNALGVHPYHNYRSASEQATLREEAWA